METWYVDITFVTETAVDDDAAFDLMEALGGVPMGRSTDLTECEIGITVEARTAIEATEIAAARIRDAALKVIGSIDVVGIDVMTQDRMEMENNRPLVPEVVGYAEIARMAGVSRQRARQFAESAGFPKPIIETEQGPLRTKTAVESWLRTRTAKPGRPRKTPLSA